jgi:acetolactate synthase regulatory subunit
MKFCIKVMLLAVIKSRNFYVPTISNSNMVDSRTSEVEVTLVPFNLYYLNDGW